MTEAAQAGAETRRVNLAADARQKISGVQYAGGEKNIEVSAHVAARLVTHGRATYADGASGDAEDALAGVDFASGTAGKEAREAGLRAAHFADKVPEGEGGYTAEQVREIISAQA